MRTTPNPGTPRRPTASAPAPAPAPAPPVRKRQIEIDEDLGKKRRSTYWDLRDDSDVRELCHESDRGLLWGNTNRRPSDLSSPTHELVLRQAKQILVGRIFSGEGPQLYDGRMCWPESSPAALSRLIGEVWLDSANKLGVEIGLEEECVTRRPRNFEARKVSWG